jgi:hypothetical protein
MLGVADRQQSFLLTRRGALTCSRRTRSTCRSPSTAIGSSATRTSPGAPRSAKAARRSPEPARPGAPARRGSLRRARDGGASLRAAEELASGLRFDHCRPPEKPTGDWGQGIGDIAYGMSRSSGSSRSARSRCSRRSTAPRRRTRRSPRRRSRSTLRPTSSEFEDSLVRSVRAMAIESRRSPRAGRRHAPRETAPPHGWR